MAAVETKVPGYFTDKMSIGEETAADDDADGFGTKALVLKVRPLPLPAFVRPPLSTCALPFDP